MDDAPVLHASGADDSARRARFTTWEKPRAAASLSMPGDGIAHPNAVPESFGRTGWSSGRGESGPSPRDRGTALFRISTHVVQRAQRAEPPAPRAR
jgi:hypothetical protein